MVTPFQAAQLDEARNRHQSITDDTGNEIEGGDPHQTPIDDATGEPLDPARQPQERQQQEEPDRDTVIKDRRAPADIKRAEIAKRFRRNADGEGDVPYNGNPNDPEMQYGKVARPADADPDPEPSIVGQRTEDTGARAQADPEPRDQPKKKLVIRGKELWLTDAEILARASMVEAADSYLQESKDLLAEARDIRNRAKRSGPDPQHPEDDTGAQDDEPNADTSEARQHPDELEQAIEEIQFGDPKDAAKKIRNVIEKATDESADARQQKRLIENDLATSQKVLKAFMDQNPELAKDEVANVVLEKSMYDIYREDILQLGVDPSQLPKANNELANWHRFYRVNGKPVRTTEQALNEAKSRFDKWRGVAPKPASAGQAKPRIDVNVDRTARRENIPIQPTRAVAPRPDATRQAPTTRSRTEIVMQMRKQRGQVVG